MAKSIVDKLQLQKYNRIAVLDEPAGRHYFAGLAPYDTGLKGGGYDLIFAFALDLASLRRLVGQVIDSGCLEEGGYLYAAYPKKGNKVYPTYIHRDELFAGLGADPDGYIGASGLKFARMVGLDDVFTVVGFKREGRKASAAASASKPSQRVGDYADRVADVERDLRDAPETLAFYQSLTPGYRKDWARYVYSAVQEETRAKRREEMRRILAAGYKSIDLYRRR